MERLQLPTQHDLFQSLCSVTMRHACMVLQLADTPCPWHRVIELLRTAPHNLAEARSSDFQANSLCCESLRIAARWVKRPGGNPESQAALADAEWHFLGVIPRLNRSQRSLLEAAIAGVVWGMEQGQKPMSLRAG